MDSAAQEGTERMTRRLLAPAILALAAGSCTTIKEVVMPGRTRAFHVAPDGSDENPGTRRKPFATLHAARDAARALGAEEPRRIVVGGGEYLLDEPLVLDARDAGLTVEAARGARAVLYGGRKVTGWHLTPGWRVPIMAGANRPAATRGARASWRRRRSPR